jgi:hypothetical protein
MTHNSKLTGIVRYVELHKLMIKVKLSRYGHAGAKRKELLLLLICDLGTTCGRVVSVTPQPRFTPRNGPPVPIV